MKDIIRLILFATYPSHVTFAALSQILLYKPKENIWLMIPWWTGYITTYLNQPEIRHEGYRRLDKLTKLLELQNCIIPGGTNCQRGHGSALTPRNLRVFPSYFPWLWFMNYHQVMGTSWWGRGGTVGTSLTRQDHWQHCVWTIQNIPDGEQFKRGSSQDTRPNITYWCFQLSHLAK